MSNPSRAKVGKVNGTLLGAAVYLGADVVKDVGAQDLKYITFQVTASPGRVILDMVA